MAITRTPIKTLGSKVLISNTARKFYAITAVHNPSEAGGIVPHIEDTLVASKQEKGGCIFETYVEDSKRLFKVWDASTTGGATGDPIINGVINWSAGAAQGYVPLTNGLVVEALIPCVVIWDT